MADQVKVPKLGNVPKKPLIVVGVVAGAFVAWKYWQARQTASDAPVDPGMEDPGTLPAVDGAVDPNGRFGRVGDTSTQTSSSTALTTNAEWTAAVTERLTTDDRWSSSDVALALGNYLTNQPLSDEQQAIVRAAIAAAGYPPVGSYSIVTGGNTPITVAPGGVGVSSITPTQALVNFNAVPGAVTYNAYRSNSTGATNVASGTNSRSPIQLVGLTPNTEYTVTVAAVSKAGAVGPKSAAVKFKTAVAAIQTPRTPTVSNIQTNRVTLSTGSVPYATSYKWYVSGRLAGTSDGPTWTATGMSPKTNYTASVVADVATQGASSKPSGTVRFRTK